MYTLYRRLNTFPLIPRLVLQETNKLLSPFDIFNRSKQLGRLIKFEKIFLIKNLNWKSKNVLDRRTGESICSSPTDMDIKNLALKSSLLIAWWQSHVNLQSRRSSNLLLANLRLAGLAELASIIGLAKHPVRIIISQTTQRTTSPLNLHHFTKPLPKQTTSRQKSLYPNLLVNLPVAGNLPKFLHQKPTEISPSQTSRTLSLRHKLAGRSA